MQTFNAMFRPRQWVSIKVTGQRAIITGVHIRDINAPRYDLLYVTPIDNARTELQVDEYEIEELQENATHPFPDPFVTASSEV